MYEAETVGLSCLGLGRASFGRPFARDLGQFFILAHSGTSTILFTNLVPIVWKISNSALLNPVDDEARPMSPVDRDPGALLTCGNRCLIILIK